MWVYSSIKESVRPIRIFNYQPGWSGSYPQILLKGFNGYIYPDVLPRNTSGPESMILVQAIWYINQLFELENRLEVFSAEGRKEQRLIQEKTVLYAFGAWAETASTRILPKSKRGEAFTYAFNQKEGLMNYLLEGNCAISNNLAENSIRPFTIDWRNWLFSGSPKGAEASAGVYTLIETAKANGPNPRKYIQYILGDISGIPFYEYPEYLEDYLPWNEHIQKICR